MVFKEAFGKNLFPFEEAGDMLSGIYQGMSEDGKDALVKAEDGTIYHCGSIVVINKLKNVKVNSKVRIEFLKMETSKKTRMAYRNFKVEYEE